MSGWQPIATAPKDEKHVIICTANGIVGEARYFENDRWYWSGYDPSDYVDGSVEGVTLWMPLPSPPEQSE